MRRVQASTDHRSKSPSVGAEKGRLHSLEVVGPMEGYGAVAISFVGRDWFPGGPYSPPGRGSIPRRSTLLTIAKSYPLVNRSS